jgi:hypothetical protein
MVGDRTAGETVDYAVKTVRFVTEGEEAMNRCNLIASAGLRRIFSDVTKGRAEATAVGGSRYKEKAASSAAFIQSVRVLTWNRCSGGVRGQTLASTSIDLAKAVRCLSAAFSSCRVSAKSPAASFSPNNSEKLWTVPYPAIS